MFPVLIDYKTDACMAGRVRPDAFIHLNAALLVMEKIQYRLPQARIRVFADGKRV
jgi:hypothetical protein